MPSVLSTKERYKFRGEITCPHLREVLIGRTIPRVAREVTTYEYGVGPK